MNARNSFSSLDQRWSVRMRNTTTRVVLPALAIVAAILSPEAARGALCNTQSYAVYSFGADASCFNSTMPDVHTCALVQSFACADGAELGPRRCAFEVNNSPQCLVSTSCDQYLGTMADLCAGQTVINCTLGTPEKCDDNIDNNFDGCINEGCTIGVGACTCTGKCDGTQSCTAPAEAKCEPFKATTAEVCGNGVDDNCNGLVDEGCAPAPEGCPPGQSCAPNGPKPPKRPSCGAAGDDPIVLFTKSAATTPFTDFEAESLGRLGLSRTYTSADASLQVGPAGVFGPGWHHDWEASLSCVSGYCTVSRGLQGGYTFRSTGIARSPAGDEDWEIYGRGDAAAIASDGHGILVRRPTGTWIYFSPDGTEYHFATVCDTCGGGTDRTCVDPRQEGIALLVNLYDPRGNRTHLSYDRASGLLLGLTDDLGHSLELRGGGCSAARATELRYDGAVVATYLYAGDQLDRAVDADGNVLRRYFYHPTGLLQAVVNEGGAAIAEFAYDPSGNAVGVIDRASDVSVAYSTTGAGNLQAEVTERYDGTSAISTREFDHDAHVVSIAGECACGPRRSFVWKDRNPECADNGDGTWTYRQHDAQGRMTYTATYPSSEVGFCPPGNWTLSSDDVQEWYEYAVVKPIATGVSLALSLQTGSIRPTGYANEWVGERIDYDPAPNAAIDPPGYQCAAVALPAGAVPCRRITNGAVHDYYGTRSIQRYATFYSYDARGRLVRTYGPVNLDAPSPDDVPPIEERTYWAEGESLARRGRLHEVKRYASPSAAPLVTTFDYDTFGPYAITDPMGTTTLFIKDGRGRTRFVVSAGQRVETRFYDGNEPRLTLSAGGAVVRTSYDSRGRALTVEHLDGDPDAPGATPQVAWSEHTIYDSAGNAIHVERRDAAGAVAWAQDRHYDVQHRVTNAPHPERPAAGRAWTYDTSGFLAAVTDEEQRKTTFTPDARRRVATVTQSGLTSSGSPISSTIATYQYAPRQGTLAGVVNGKGLTTRYTRDDFGRLTHLRAFTFVNDQQVYYFAYDARGNLVERRSSNQTLRYTFDGLDRVTTILAQDCGGNDTACTRSNTTVPRVAYTYRYDENGYAGKLTSVSDAERTWRYGYDAAGRLASEQLEEPGVAALVTSYTYDADGRVSGMTYPSGLALKVERDRGTGEVRKVSSADGATTYVDAVERWPGGPVRSLTFGTSGERLSYAVNRRYEPATLHSGPLVLDYAMTAAGDVGSVTEGGTTSRYGYDHRDRLTSVSPGAVNEQELVHKYGYTQFSNIEVERISQSGVASAAGFDMRYAYDYDYQSNVSSIGIYWGGRLGAVCLRHDALGRLVLVGPGGGGYGDFVSCTTDAAVTSVTARFRYDGQNRRIARWSAPSGEWTYYVHGPGGELLSEVRKTGDAAQPWAPVRDYVWLDGRPVVQVEYVGTTARAYAVHVDHLGTPRALTSPEGMVVWTAAVKPYGEVTEKTTPDPVTGKTVVTNLRLPGQYDERLFVAAGVGLQGPYYNWNRWYLPSVGRYLELDPIALQGGRNGDFGPDWYSYAKANPLRFTDRTGLYSEVCWRKILGPLANTQARHCFLRVGGSDGETMSYYATLPVDPWFNKAGRDLKPKNPEQCHPITPPDDPPMCKDERTPFDQCLETQMLTCTQCTYNIRSFNCCDCVANAIAACGGNYPGPWPPNYGWGPGGR